MMRPRCMALLLLATACSLAPEYHRPEMPGPMPAAYKESGEWQKAQPEAAALDRGPWWKLYNDPDLDALEDKVTAANQDLKAAVARYDEARGAARVARAALFPQLSADGNLTRQRFSKTIADLRAAKPFTDYELGGDLSYEVDLWGRVRNAANAGTKRAEASGADMAAMDVSLHAELAQDYFSLRGADASQAVLDETVRDYTRALKLARARYEGGAAARSDVDQAEAQLENAKTLASDRQLQRAQFEHAIAVLTGELPTNFSLAARRYDLSKPPLVPTGLPSELVERRPDVAAAALRVEAANADIGVARAAYCPTIALGASGGIESAVTSKLFQASSFFWTFGPSATLPLFDGGRIAGMNDEARAAYDENAANYRATVLAAFQQVEDSLAARRQLAQESRSQQAAADAANRAVGHASALYRGGISTYLDVVLQQNIALQDRLSLIDVQVRQMNASVGLIEALGGGWVSTPAP